MIIFLKAAVFQKHVEIVLKKGTIQEADNLFPLSMKLKERCYWSLYVCMLYCFTNKNLSVAFLFKENIYKNTIYYTLNIVLGDFKNKFVCSPQPQLKIVVVL